MLRNMSKLEDYIISAKDDDNIGNIRGFYFGENSWKVHYIIMDTRRWLPGRTVIVSIDELDDIDHMDQKIRLKITKERIRSSPMIEEDVPLDLHYLSLLEKYDKWSETPSERLHNSSEVFDYYIEARDGDLGHVEDLLVDDYDWMIRYIVIDTINWWPGKKVLVSTDWVKAPRWKEERVRVDMTRDRMKNAPEYSQNMTLDRDYEEMLASYYGYSGYWTEDRTKRTVLNDAETYT